MLRNPILGFSSSTSVHSSISLQPASVRVGPRALTHQYRHAAVRYASKTLHFEFRPWSGLHRQHRWRHRTTTTPLRSLAAPYASNDRSNMAARSNMRDDAFDEQHQVAAQTRDSVQLGGSALIIAQLNRWQHSLNRDTRQTRYSSGGGKYFTMAGGKQNPGDP